MTQTSYTLEGGGHAVLLLHNYADSPNQLRPFAEALQKDGLTVCVPPLFQSARHWMDWLLDARGAFIQMQNTHIMVSVCGFAGGINPALMLAEEYMVDQLLLIPGEIPHAPLSDRLKLLRLAHHARQNLFAVTAQTHVLLSNDAKHQTVRQARSLIRLLGRCAVTDCESDRLAGSVSRCLLPITTT